MGKSKCVLCGKEIDEEKEDYDFIGASNYTDYDYISSNKKLIDEEICKNELKNPNGRIKLYKNGESSLPFDFQDTVVRNIGAYDRSGFVTAEELKQICDLANSYHLIKTDNGDGYLNGKNNVGNLIKIFSSYGHNNAKINDELENFLKNKWRKKAYYVKTNWLNLFKMEIDIYIEKEDKEEFIAKVKKNIPDKIKFNHINF